jgi:site-specific recombinase XerD
VIEALSLAVRTRDYSPKTERAYVGWVRRFLDFLGSGGEVAELDPAHGAAFMQHLATHAHLSAKTRNQAASALMFLFGEVLHQEGFEDVPRAKGSQRLPSVLSHREVLAVLRELRGTHRLIASLLYAGGLRLEECLRLRVKDIDFELRQILVRDGKGKKDRYVPLAQRVVDGLRARVRRRSEQHEEDRRRGHGWAALPGALTPAPGTSSRGSSRSRPGRSTSIQQPAGAAATRSIPAPSSGKSSRRHGARASISA